MTIMEAQLLENAVQNFAGAMQHNRDRQQIDSREMQRIALEQSMKAAMPKLGNLVKSGEIEHLEALDAFRSSMDGLPPEVHEKMLQNPQYKMIYNGQIDFSKLAATPAPPNVTTTPEGGQFV